jgi:hypothetical protein
MKSGKEISNKIFSTYLLMTYLADLKARLALHNLMESASVLVPTNYCCLEMMIPT